MKISSRNLVLMISGGVIPILTSNLFLRVLCILVFILVVLDVLISLFLKRVVLFERVTLNCIASRGTTVSVHFSVHNISPLPLKNILIEDSTKGLYTRKRPLYLVDLRPFEKRSFCYNLEGHQRGIYQLGPLTASGHGPFLLSPWISESDQSCKVTILPSRKRILTRDIRGNAGGILSSNLPQYEDMTQYRSFRPYEPGDELKRIHWKISAKQGRLMTAEYERQISVPVSVILNLSDPDYCSHHSSDLQEKGIEAASSLLSHFERQGQIASLLINGQNAEYHSHGGDSYHFSRMAESLAAVKSGPRREVFPHIEKVLSLNMYQRIFIITPPLRLENAGWLGHFRSSPQRRVTLLILKCGDVKEDERCFSLFSGMEYSHLPITKKRLELLHG